MEKFVPYNPDGRPKLDPEEKRSELLKAYVTPAEADLIKVNCSLAGLSISDFLRSLALDKEIKPVANPDDLKSIRAEIGKIGGNINQIAKKVNEGKVDRLDEETVEMEVEVMRDGEPEIITQEMNFGKLILYLQKELKKLDL